MDQKELRELEYRCIQEEAAECIAACPIHVDARSLSRHIQTGAWDDAWKVLRKTMPFPGILGRICDAPCRGKCKRREKGDPIEIGALERVCVSRPAPKFVMPHMPKKDKCIAVLGSGLSSLTVCWDLARKGYRLTIFEPGKVLGGPLNSIEEKRLSARIIEQETAVLDKLGVGVQFEAPALDEDFLGQCIRDFDAVYIGLDAISAGNSGLQTAAGGSLDVTDKMQTTGLDKVFAGGCSQNSAASPVWQAAEGRWAATSMDRYLQKVSMTAGREKDGPYRTRLFTSTAGVRTAPAVPMADPEAGYTEEEAIREAERCLLCECLECVKVCVYLEHFGAYPKRYAREIYNNESIVMGIRQANKLINSCSLCGLCERVCPEDFAMQDLCLSTRQSMVRRNKMPVSAHEFALLDLDFSQSDAFSMVRYQPGKSAGAHLFFPGCQLCASSPGKVFATYQYLCAKLKEGVGLMLGCCSAPSYWAGCEERFQKDLGTWKQKWIELGKPTAILACSTCYRIFSDHLPEVPVVTLWHVFEKTGLPPGHATVENQSLAIHDPCTTRYEPGIRNAVRNLLGETGVIIEELSLSKDLTECCGFGGLMRNANPPVAKESIRRRSKLSALDYITYCGMCRDNLVSTGKRCLHVLDLFFPDLQDPDPAARTCPGWSRRKENRSRLKDRFKKEIWGETLAEKEEYENIRIRVAPRVREILEDRRILDEDIQKVLWHAEHSGKTFTHEKTGCLKASFKPYNVTFWVEYSKDGDTYEIHNAYSHRMEVLPV
jgi:glutamate synthase (NADPH/NADH) small chain